MKHFRLLIAALCLSLTAAAQTSIVRYPAAPAYMQHMLMDFIQDNDSHLIASGKGQYVGQVGDTYMLNGFGSYIDNTGSQRIGLFRSGQFLFGITLTSTSAIVGTADDYVCYSLTTGRVEYVFHAGQKTLADMRQTTDYAFVSMTYANGDRYIGETYASARHGLGIYYYANGDQWYGEYVGGLRKGFGCLFRTNNTLRIGFWDGEEELRCRDIRFAK